MLNILSAIPSPLELLETSSLLDLSGYSLVYFYVNMVPYRFTHSFHKRSFYCCAEQLKKHFHTSIVLFKDSNPKDIANITPIKTYLNSDVEKALVLSDNKGKCGVYRWTHLASEKCYVGSSVDLSRRLKNYYNISFLTLEIKKNNSRIYRALVKYGYSKFKLEVLEYCEPNILIDREQYYLDLLNPEYNILKVAGSRFGVKHSKASIEKMRITASKTFKSPEFLAKLSKGQSNGTKVEVTDIETNTSTTYHAIRAAARALDINKTYIEYYIYLKQDKPVLGRYTFKLVSLNSAGENTNIVNEEKVQKTAMKVEATNVGTKEVITYSSISAAARALNYRQSSIWFFIKANRTNPFKGKYLFKLVD